MTSSCNHTTNNNYRFDSDHIVDDTAIVFHIWHVLVTNLFVMIFSIIISSSWRSSSSSSSYYDSNIISKKRSNRDNDNTNVIITSSSSSFAITKISSVLRNIFKRRRHHSLSSSPPSSNNNHHTALHAAAISRKTSFLKQAGDAYGYANTPGGYIDEWRPVEHPQLLPPLKKPLSWLSSIRHLLSQAFTTTKPPLTPPLSSFQKEVYLDYAGAALPTTTQLSSPPSSSLLLGNPHSIGPASSRSLLLIQQTRDRILDMFGCRPSHVADDDSEGYDLIFTSGCTESLSLVGGRFDWTGRGDGGGGFCKVCGGKRKRKGGGTSLLVYPRECHTSVLGLREFVLEKGGRFKCVNMEELVRVKGDEIRKWEQEDLDDDDHDGVDDERACDCKDVDNTMPTTTTAVTNHLLVIPMECNFSGDRWNIHPLLEQINALNNKNNSQNNNASLLSQWYILADIAKLAATHPINLSTFQNIDFAVLSFYKIVGSPTGLGALFIRRRAECVLLSKERGYFGGGSVDVALVGRDVKVRRGGGRRVRGLVNGTEHFRGIVELGRGLDELEKRGGMRMISSHTNSLITHLTTQLLSLHHHNNTPLIQIYGTRTSPSPHPLYLPPGPTLTFNILRPSSPSSIVGYSEIQKLASLHDPPIQLRTGCFCNPGACQLALGWDDDDVFRNYEEGGHICGDERDLVGDDGRPTGAVRVSVGKDSAWEDIDAFVEFVKRYFLECTPSISSSSLSSSFRPRRASWRLDEVYVYPIKSCHAQRVRRWPIDKLTARLKYDREFALVTSDGTAMRLQSHPNMALLQPVVNEAQMTMTVTMMTAASGSSSGDELTVMMEPLVIDLNDDTAAAAAVADDDDDRKGRRDISVCGKDCRGVIWGEKQKASEWFTAVLGVRCYLARYYQSPPSSSSISDETRQEQQQQQRQQQQQQRQKGNNKSSAAAFANDSPLLLICRDSVHRLNQILHDKGKPLVTERHFRPNWVISSSLSSSSSSLVTRTAATSSNGDEMVPTPSSFVNNLHHHVEDSWQRIILPKRDLSLTVVGQCARCAMVDMDPTSGLKEGDTLMALADYRRRKGKIYFGIFLSGMIDDKMEEVGMGEEQGEVWMEEGDEVVVE